MVDDTSVALENGNGNVGVPPLKDEEQTDFTNIAVPVIPTIPEEESAKNLTGKKKRRHNRRQWLVLITLAFGNFCAAASTSLQSPFYPSEAERKGATPTEYGLVFGIFQLTVFIVSPLYGKIIGIVTPKFMLNAGLFLVGSSSILFGILDRSPDGVPFVALSMAVRIIEGVGSAAFTTSSFTIIAAEFPDNVATTFASLETMFGFGLIAGPTLGGALYDLGGFPLPFIVVGVLLLCCAVITKLVLPTSDNEVKLKSGNLSKFWSNFSVILDALVIFTTFFCIGFNAATLEPHLRKFQLSAFLLGTIFIVPGGIFGATAPLWGYLCEKKVDTKMLCLLGLGFECVCYTFLAPLPFVPYEAQIWTVILSLVAFGLGAGSTLVAAFVGALKDTVKLGFPDDVSTYGLVSSLYAAGNSLGAFLGPTVGGYVLEVMGYRNGSLVVMALLLILIAIMICFVTWRRTCGANSKTNMMLSHENVDEKKPLLAEDRCAKNFSNGTNLSRQLSKNGVVEKNGKGLICDDTNL